MAKRKQKYKQKHKQHMHKQPSHTHRAPAPPAASDPRQIEEIAATVLRLREEHGLETDEETASFLQDLIMQNGGKMPTLPPRTPLEEAQGLFYRALEVKGRRRIELARKALEVSPDCADAYVLLAEETGDEKQARPLYEQGVAAAERVIGPELFASEAGQFWSNLRTRPYLRALEGLADVCWYLGERQESIEHLQELLRLDAEDYLSARHRLAARLLTVGDDASVQALLERFPEDDSASWLYSRALLLFRRHGDGDESLRALAEALEANSFVPLYLLGLEKLPRRLPEIIEAGEQSEAVEYVVQATFAWANAPGSLEWLATLVELAMTQALGDDQDDDPPDLFPLTDPPNVLRPFWQ
jgi:tetratricopeptide (TPR) repeat protein